MTLFLPPLPGRGCGRLACFGLLTLFAVVGAACGGGGGGDAEPGGTDGDGNGLPPQEVLLLRAPARTNGLTVSTNADRAEVSLEFGPFPPRVLLFGEVFDADDGVLLEADPTDPVYAETVTLLTNGQPDSFEVLLRLAFGGTGTGFSDATPSNFAVSDLPGPDLVGATITRLAFRVDSVEITSGSSSSLALSGEAQVFGFAP